MTDQVKTEVDDSFYNTEEQEPNLDDVFAMDLESLDKDIPVDIDDVSYLLSIEEEKQLEELLKKKSNSDFVIQTFKSLERRPSETEIETLKGKHGEIYLCSLSEKENFLFRPLKRQEWRELMQRFEKSKLSEQQRTEGIVMAGVVWPLLNQANINVLTAGAPEAIRNLILQASNFMEPERAVTLVRKL
jgi:hypothetical protein